jgi:hypothetical protein
LPNVIVSLIHMLNYLVFLNWTIHINLIFILILQYKIDDIMKYRWMEFIHPIFQIENDLKL